MTKTNKQIANEVADIYCYLNEQLKNHSPECSACGDCCDFESFGHRLFVTSAEMVYLSENLDIKPMTAARCPYQSQGKCTIHAHRFAACRIFFCKGNEDFQSQLSEDALKQLKSVCIKFDLPYQYADLATALNNPPEQPQPPHPA